MPMVLIKGYIISSSSWSLVADFPGLRCPGLHYLHHLNSADVRQSNSVISIIGLHYKIAHTV